jgi:hypothetical protein
VLGTLFQQLLDGTLTNSHAENENNSYEGYGLGGEVHPDTVLILFTIYEKFVNPNSLWAPYFAILPAVTSHLHHSYTTHTPTVVEVQDVGNGISCSAVELVSMDGLPLMYDILEQRDALRMVSYRHELFHCLSLL